MALSDIKDSKSILAAVREFDEIGREAFLEKYSCKPAKSYYLALNGQEYDSKAIIGAAHGYEFPDQGPLSPREFSGGEETVKPKLEDLGFQVIYYDPVEHRKARVFGDIPDVEVGAVFASREDISKAGVHRLLVAGISGSAKEGADSIVLSGGYEDDQDFGDEIIYTGHGGNDSGTKKQVADQVLEHRNLALAKNKITGLPVRVVRGAAHKSPYSPENGYRYDGLFRVEDYWHETGRSGFRIYRYRLRKVLDQEQPPPTPQQLSAETTEPVKRQEALVSRLVRDTRQAVAIKQLYNYQCQICGCRLETPVGPYAEGAHIKPLGKPHNGPDVAGNILCLCPNHHVLFDSGAIAIADDLTLLGIEGRLTIKTEHNLNSEFLCYHREKYWEVM